MIHLAVKDAVLEALEQARGARLSGGKLAEQLGVSRAAVHKAISTLRADGLHIDGVPGEGYRLAPEDDSLTAAGIAALLQTEHIGRGLIVEPVLVSTNTVLKEQYLDRPHGFTLVAEAQTGGRGRLGRTFVSPAARYEAVCTGLDDEGHLLIRTANGETRALSTGEISIRL